MEDIIQKIYDYSLEEIMGERFGSYSKYIIQDRAIPDVRDGLKPVQRRILYSMYKERNTYEKPYKKSARAVGDVMGKYHPHGDSSIYDAIVRMSQDWKMREPFADMQGNNGSIDGDSAAAALGNPRVLNVVLLGAAVRTGALGLTEEDILNVMGKVIREKFLDLNRKAFTLA